MGVPMGAEPKAIGRFEIEGVLGRGAMGVVYLARDPVIGRKVALKTLVLPEGADEAEEFRIRFLREAQAAGILNHPGIVTVYDAGVDEATGLSYIAMEFVEGKSLRDLMRQGYPFSYSDVARIGAALAVALDYAHAKGVVHRDIKPANILITDQGAVKITDFGVARLATSSLTTTGQFIGTPNYMSPEQVTGSPVDGRSDLFSLGVVLFELLTGKRPFAGESVTEVSYKIVHEPPPVPSQLRPGLPPAFNPIILKLLEKKPENRYARGLEVARALEALRRVLAGTGETLVPRVLEGESAATAASQAVVVKPEMAATATKATVLAEGGEKQEEKEETPSIWRLPIATRWVVILLAAVLLPPLVTVAVLYGKIDRGPFAGPPPGEPARRHQLAMAVRRAASLLPQDPERSLALLAPVWDQAPQSPAARAVAEKAREALAHRQELATQQAKIQALLDEGMGLLRQGRVTQARQAFQAVLELDPENVLAQRGLELSRGGGGSRPGEAQVQRLGQAAQSTPVGGSARLELYFNSPLSNGEFELELDGALLGRKAFDFGSKGFLGIRKRGTGIVEDAFPVNAGGHKLLVRLKGERGEVLGEQVFTVQFAAGGRYVLRVEMFSEKEVPRFSLSARK